LHVSSASVFQAPVLLATQSVTQTRLLPNSLA